MPNHVLLIHHKPGFGVVDVTVANLQGHSSELHRTFKNPSDLRAALIRAGISEHTFNAAVTASSHAGTWFELRPEEAQAFLGLEEEGLKQW